MLNSTARAVERAQATPSTGCRAWIAEMVVSAGVVRQHISTVSDMERNISAMFRSFFGRVIFVPPSRRALPFYFAFLRALLPIHSKTVPASRQKTPVAANGTICTATLCRYANTEPAKNARPNTAKTMPAAELRRALSSIFF